MSYRGPQSLSRHHSLAHSVVRDAQRAYDEAAKNYARAHRASGLSQAALQLSPLEHYTTARKRYYDDDDPSAYPYLSQMPDYEHYKKSSAELKAFELVYARAEADMRKAAYLMAKHAQSRSPADEAAAHAAYKRFAESQRMLWLVAPDHIYDERSRALRAHENAPLGERTAAWYAANEEMHSPGGLYSRFD
jgi:hypothetical protein